MKGSANASVLGARASERALGLRRSPRVGGLIVEARTFDVARGHVVDVEASDLNAIDEILGRAIRFRDAREVEKRMTVGRRCEEDARNHAHHSPIQY